MTRRRECTESGRVRWLAVLLCSCACAALDSASASTPPFAIRLAPTATPAEVYGAALLVEYIGNATANSTAVLAVGAGAATSLGLPASSLHGLGTESYVIVSLVVQCWSLVARMVCRCVLTVSQSACIVQPVDVNEPSEQVLCVSASLSLCLSNCLSLCVVSLHPSISLATRNQNAHHDSHVRARTCTHPPCIVLCTRTDKVHAQHNSCYPSWLDGHQRWGGFDAWHRVCCGRPPQKARVPLLCSRRDVCAHSGCHRRRCSGLLQRWWCIRPLARGACSDLEVDGVVRDQRCRPSTVATDGDGRTDARLVIVAKHTGADASCVLI